MENRYVLQYNLKGSNTLDKLYLDTVWAARVVGRALGHRCDGMEIVDRMTGEVLWIAEGTVEKYDVTRLG